MSMKMGSLKPVADTHRYNYYVFTSTKYVCVCIQMVWARTYAVGCGAFRCAELEGAEDAYENALFLVCNYGPGFVALF